MKRILVKCAASVVGALTLGVIIGIFATRTPATENAEAKTASTTNQAISIVMQFPMVIAK